MRFSPRRSAAALCALASLLGSAFASAQPAPDAPPPADAAQPAPDPAQPPPPADPAAQPPADAAATPPPPPPGPTPTYTAPTPSASEPDRATTEDKVEKRKPGAAWVRWRGSALNWSHDVTTTAVGIGRDNIGGENEVYSQGFSGTFNFFIVDEKKFRLRGTTALGFDVELTNAGDTTTRREPRFRDIPITFATGALTALASDDDEWAFGFIPNITNIIPTSPVSQDRGINWTISPRLLTFFAFPLLGNDSEHLKGMFSGVSVRYDRTFTNANVPTNSGIDVPRTDPSGTTFLSDQISGNRLGQNTLRVGGFLFLEEHFGPSTLWVSGGPSWSVTFLPEFEDVDCVQTQTGCERIEADPNAPNTRINAGFGASVSYFPSAEFGVDVSYSNNTLQLGEDGQRRDIFYSPDAVFSATLIVSVDAIYERIVSDPRADPLIIFGKNTPAPTQGPQQPSKQVPTAFATF